MAEDDPPRKVVFIGNCQMLAVQALYRRFVVPYQPAHLTHVASYANLSDTARDAIAAADDIVVQVQDFTAKVGALDLPATARRFMVPVLAGNFLWPHGGRPRPDNKPAPGLPEGPFSMQLGDSWLNRMIQQGADPVAAAEEYRSLDIGKTTDLDRLFDIVVSKQARLDGELGYDIAGLIRAHFRTEQLFRTLFHPSPRLMNHIGATLFAQMGVDTAIVDRIGRLQRHVNQPVHELPVHPSVVRHFGLSYITQATTYQYLNEGACGFDEWVRRYLVAEWNQPLAAGIALAEQPDRTEQALALLEDGLAASPGSDQGWRALSLVLERLGRRDDAVAALRRALTIAPDVPLHHQLHAQLAVRAGDFATASESFSTLLALDPASAEAQRMVLHIRVRLGDAKGAVQAAETMLTDAVEPPTPALFAEIAELKRRTGQTAGPLLKAEDAARANPGNAAAQLLYAEQLDVAKRGAEAKYHLSRAGTLAARDATTLVRIARAHALRHDAAEAVALLLDVLALKPERAETLTHAAHLLARFDRHAEAERACVESIALQPLDDALHLFRSNILLRLGRVDDALRAAETAIRLNPGKANYHGHVGQVLLKAGDPAQAEVSFRNAIGFDAGHAGYRQLLAVALQRMGNRDAAMDAVREGLALAPADQALIRLRDALTKAAPAGGVGG